MVNDIKAWGAVWVVDTAQIYQDREAALWVIAQKRQYTHYIRRRDFKGQFVIRNIRICNRVVELGRNMIRKLVW
jgi:hypothetical protein